MGRKIVFNDKLNVIAGNNQSGKTTLVSSVLYSLGVLPILSDKEIFSGLITVVEFELDEVSYYVLRNSRKDLYVFDAHKRLKLCGFDAYVAWILGVLGISSFFDCYKQIESKKINMLYSPFYISQDRGWGSVWGSLLDGSTNNDVKRDYLLYFLNAIDDSFFVARASVRSLEEAAASIDRKLKIQNEMYEDAIKDSKGFGLNVDLNEFRTEVSAAVLYYRKAYEAQGGYRSDVADLQRKKFEILAKIKSLNAERNDLLKDREFALGISDEMITCPLCKTKHENSFYNLLSINIDIDQVENSLTKMQFDLDGIEAEIKTKNQAGFEALEKSGELYNYLEAMVGGESFVDVIEIESKKYIVDKFLKELNYSIDARKGVEEDIHKSNIEIVNYREGIKRVDKMLIDSTENVLQRLRLPVDEANRLSYFSARYSGSARPRAILSFMMATIDVASRASGRYILPMIIDAPLQQSQDSQSYHGMLDIVKSCSIAYTQCIVAINTDNVSVLGEKPVCMLHDYASAFIQSDFQECSEVIGNFQMKTMPLFW